MSLTVADIMQREVVSISPSESLRALIRLLRRHRISGVPVVEEDHRVVGMATVSDLLWLSERLVPGGSPVVEASAASKELDERTVRDIMTPDVFGVEPTADLAELGSFFARTGLGRAVVLDEGRLAGVVSVTDLLGLIAEGRPRDAEA